MVDLCSLSSQRRCVRYFVASRKRLTLGLFSNRQSLLLYYSKYYYVFHLENDTVRGTIHDRYEYLVRVPSTRSLSSSRLTSCYNIHFD